MNDIRTRMMMDYFRKDNPNTRVVTKLGSDDEYVFTAKSGREALEKMIYTLNTSGKCNSEIKVGPSGKTLFFKHNEDVYATANR